MQKIDNDQVKRKNINLIRLIYNFKYIYIYILTRFFLIILHRVSKEMKTIGSIEMEERWNKFIIHRKLLT